MQIYKIFYAILSSVKSIDELNNLYRSDYDIKTRKVTGYFVASTNVASFRSNPADNLKENVMEATADQWGRVTERKAYPNWPDKTTSISESFQYDISGNLIGYIDPKGNLNEDGVTKGYKYDKLGRLIQVKDALDQLTDIEYTVLGQIKTIKLSDQNTTTPIVLYTKAYNELGAMTAKTDNTALSITSKYNNLGLPKEIIDRNNTKFTTQYDEQNRLITDTAVSADNTQSIIFEYLYQEPYGPSAIYNNGHLFYQYNSQGWVTDKDIASSIDNYTSTFINQYDRAGKVKSNSVGINDTALFYTNYQYNKSRLEKVQTNGAQTADATGQAYATYAYYLDGKLKTITYPKLTDGSSLTANYEYDKLSRLLNLANKKGDTIISKYSYTYDANGNIETVTELVGANTTTTAYHYDKLNRLLDIIPSVGKPVYYTYDLRGNRQTQQDKDFVPDFDDVSYTFNIKSQLTQVVKGSITANFKYSPDGYRYEKSAAASTERYHYNLAGKVVAQSDGNNTITADYVWGPDRALVKKDKAANKDYN